MSQDHLAASCLGCGASIEIRVHDPVAVCPFCDVPNPVPPAVAQRVDALRATLERFGGRAQQLVGKQIFTGRMIGGYLLISIITVWLLVGGVLFFMVDHPQGVGTVDVLLKPFSASEGGHPIIVRFWTAFATASGIALAAFSFGGLRIAFRGAVRHAYPLPPADLGRPPRCRLCAADLPVEGLVRRCSHCDADNLVLGENYKRHTQSLEASLQSMAREAQRGLAAYQRWADRSVILSVVASLAVAFLLPGAFMFMHETYPALWVIPGALLGGATLFALWTRMRPVLAVRSVLETRIGDAMEVAGHRGDVIATFSFCFTTTLPEFDKMYVLRDAGGVLHGFTVGYIAGKDCFWGELFLVADGAARSEELVDVVPRRERLAVSPQGPWADYSELWQRTHVKDSRPCAMDAWLGGKPTTGQAPSLRFELLRCVEEHELVLLSAAETTTSIERHTPASVTS